MVFEVDNTGRLTVERSFVASPDELFDAFTDSEVAPVWMWAGLGSRPRSEVDLRVGGRYRMAIDPPDGSEGWSGGEDAFSGVYIEVDRPSRLAYTLHWEADVGYNRDGADVPDEAVVVDIEKTDDGCVLTFQHLGIPNDGASAVEHGRAAEAMFDLLEEVLAG